MNCKICGSPLNNGDEFCSNCGTKVENNVTPVQNIEDTRVNMTPVTPIQNIEDTRVDIAPITPIQNNVVGDTLNQNNNFTGGNTSVKKDWKPIVSLIAAIVALVLSFIFGFMVIPLSIFAIIVGAISKEKCGKRTAGIIIGIISIITSIVMTVVVAGGLILLLFSLFTSTKTFEGNGYTLEYNFLWKEGNLSNGYKVLYYNDSEAYLGPIAKTGLDTTISCDFSLDSCQTKIYDEFYDLWNKNTTDNGYNLYKDNLGFSRMLFDKEIYIAQMDFGKSSTNLNGRYYVLVDKDNNAVLSFMVRKGSDTSDSIFNQSKLVLESIEVDPVEKTVNDDQKYINELLEKMRDWNKYSYLRTGTLGKNKELNGGWRILDTSKGYWVFKNGEFWWYKDYNDLNDNYWYGTTEIISGKSGIEKFGLNYVNVQKQLSESNTNVTIDDYYAIVATPKKIISGGVDKTSTNIKDGDEFNLVWVIVDHGNEGIEGQVYNVISGDIAYYYKMND